jgi:hypothetical protein
MTPTDRLPRQLAALSALLSSVPHYHMNTLANAYHQTDGQIQAVLSLLTTAVRTVHVDGEGLINGCSVCDALRDAERVLQESTL